VPRFKTDAHLAAMSQRAAQVLRSQAKALTPAGGVANVPVAAPLQLPRSFLGGRVNQLGGLARMGAQMVAALKQPSLYRGPDIQQQLAQQAAGAMSGMNSVSDFTRGYLGSTGWRGSDEAFRDYAAQFAPGGFVPHSIMHEGEVTYQGGRPGVFIKYSAPGRGSDTVWIPVEQQAPAAAAPARPGGYW
jgi:hypothetical protein